ncbi:Ubiquinone/menaquinone biosynthesis methyltransferase ubiE [Toxocara canis]|uniref:Ubiquinone/menaquinone biosynthesis methyltransferase ubiE n=1 Tax=Toxocara canis TaxID=6265 RepID=A0A0B2VPD0_TOXCA|nr:Ubiquinone/menaquinone biosynthesis methyltransferase ubiE [Toxocara canis]
MANFDQTLLNIATNGMLSIVISLGQQLKLFDALAEIGSESSPATAKDVANRLKLKERYVKEWLCCMAAGDIIEVDESGENFWIPKDRIPSLCGDTVSMAFTTQSLVPLFSAIIPKVAETFKQDGPYGVNYDQYNGIHKVIDDISRTQQRKYLINDLLPLTGMMEKMNDELKVLDVGCGNGYQILEIAQHFPRSKFIGIDLSADAIASAERTRQERQLNNVSFVQMNAQKLAEDWSDRFDWITVFDACHDQTRPDLSLKEIHRVLKSNGTLTVFETNGTGNVYTDKIEFGKQAAFGYAISVLACLQVGSQSEDALCLGSMWGRKRAMQLLNESGFHNVQQIETPFLRTKILYVCHK